MDSIDYVARNCNSSTSDGRCTGNDQGSAGTATVRIDHIEPRKIEFVPSQGD